MRRWFLVLMIALLPLRGWVGDAMAVEVSAQPAHASMVMEADHSDDHTAHAVHCACEDEAIADKADHQHGACEVCNLPALALAVMGLQPPPAAHRELAVPSEPFASSEAQRGVKPPIS